MPCELRTSAPIEAVPAGSETPPDACVIGATGLFTPRPAFPDKPIYAAVLFSMFLHGSILHLLVNMLFLWVFGNNVEDQLGPIWFLVLYLVGGIVASIAHVAGNLHSVDAVHRCVGRDRGGDGRVHRVVPARARAHA